jgi:hypothetical protein
VVRRGAASTVGSEWGQRGRNGAGKTRRERTGAVGGADRSREEGWQESSREEGEDRRGCMSHNRGSIFYLNICCYYQTQIFFVKEN